jgi:putative DNA primase/helicase
MRRNPMSFYLKLITAMENEGYFIDGSINLNSNKFQRFKNKNARKKGKDIFIRIHGNGEGASFGDWHDRDNWKTIWDKNYRELSIEEKIKRDIALEQIKREEWERKNKAIHRMTLLWEKHCQQDADLDHPYMIKKQLWRSLYARRLRSHIIIPIHDIDYNLISLQKIRANGFKTFISGTSPSDGMCWLSEPLPSNYDGVIRLCEGWATGVTIYEAIGGPIICAMNAYNMVNVAIAFHKRYPNAILKICADDDAYTLNNIGFICAVRAKLHTGGTIYYPDFSQLDCSKKPTDFNDLMCLAGIEEVERQLNLIRK